MSEALPSAWRVGQALTAAMTLINQLEAADPDTDEEALREAVENETDALVILRRVIRVYLEANAFEDALKARIAALESRQKRFRHRAEAAKITAFTIMEAIQQPKFVDPEFTALIAAGRRAVVVTDETKLADAFIKVERTPMKAAIAEALKEGPVPGAEWSNPMPTLTIRSK